MQFREIMGLQCILAVNCLLSNPPLSCSKLTMSGQTSGYLTLKLAIPVCVSLHNGDTKSSKVLARIFGWSNNIVHPIDVDIKCILSVDNFPIRADNRSMLAI